jgi:peroxiredoxin
VNRLLLLLLLLLPFALGARQTAHTPVPLRDARQDSTSTPLPDAQFPPEVVSVTGEKIDVAKLAKERRIVVVTLKATWCQVCQRQLARIKKQLDQIKYCSVTFLVLAPGPADELKAIQKRTGFPYPFIEDQDLKIGQEMRLVLSEKDQELIPAIFILNPDRTVGWIQLGRNPISYGDAQLLAEIDCGDWI